MGLVLLLVGVLCLGYLAYQYWGTNEVSRHAYDTEKTAPRELAAGVDARPCQHSRQRAAGTATDAR